MKRHILCLGDSNTHGRCADPLDCADGGIRFNEDERWTCLLQKTLGNDYLVTEEGLSGRTTVFSDPLEESMDALSVLYSLLKSHAVIDLLIIMLGTNDTKPVFNASPEEIARSMRRLMLRVRNYLQVKEQKRRVLLISPVPMTTSVLCSGIEFDLSSVEKSRRLAPLYQTLAKELEVDFWDAGSAGIQLCGDGCHFSEQGHRQFAERMEEKVREILFS